MTFADQQERVEGSVTVTLAWAEILIAANVGCMRNVQSLRAGRVPGNGIGVDDTWTANIEGAAGEMAVAKHLGRYWYGAIGDLGARDVGPYQVKTNMSRKFDDLILRRTDPIFQRYVLVLSFLPRFILCGWIDGCEGMQDKWFRDGAPRRPAFFVPRDELNPMETLLSGETAE